MNFPATLLFLVFEKHYSGSRMYYQRKISATSRGHGQISKTYIISHNEMYTIISIQYVDTEFRHQAIVSAFTYSLSAVTPD